MAAADGPVRGDISLLALRYAAAVRDGDADRTTARLYRFNTAPPTPAQARLLGDPVAARQLLMAAAGLDRRGGGGEYTLTTEPATGWLYWRSAAGPRSGAVRTRTAGRPAAMRKLYITAKLDHLPLALRAVFQTARQSDITVVKFGADYANLRRPDRIVLYTRDRQQAEEVGAALRAALDGIPADMLPFAERIAPAVFSGLDPPPPPATAATRASWRGWLCQTVAEALHQAPPDSAELAVAAAMQRCRLLGLDPASWRVDDGFFAELPGAA